MSHQLTLKESMDAVESACIKASAETLAMGGCPRPQIHLFFEDWDQPYVGYIVCRRYSRGQDAAEAIAALGKVAAAFCATRVMLLWEEQDLRVSLQEEVPRPNGLVSVLASFEGYTLRWHPCVMKFKGQALAPSSLEWGPDQQFENTPLPQPIHAALANWQNLLEAPELRMFVAEMEQQGYEFHMVKRP